ncbi:unnamed protein product [Echinostoma caproni]|uniref:Uncharacterized protein n=1 Tax=Echinostoma caproni TaxID=27848 RepID=A0A183A2J0_9TREM|nr:unnamed protein product [Echinostoma caproni]
MHRNFILLFLGPPVDFQPIPDYRPSHGVFLPDRSPIGCECDHNLELEKETESDDCKPLEPCWENRRRRCCAATAGALIPYNRHKRLAAPVGHAVYECNSA